MAPTTGTPCCTAYGTNVESLVESCWTMAMAPSVSTIFRTAASAVGGSVLVSTTRSCTGWPLTPPCSLFTHCSQALATPSEYLPVAPLLPVIEIGTPILIGDLVGFGAPLLLSLPAVDVFFPPLSPQAAPTNATRARRPTRAR